MENYETFSQLIAKYFVERGSILSYCRKFFPNDNTENKARVIHRWLKGERIPSFEDARDLLNNLGEKVSSQDLSELLNKSKLLKEENYSPALFCKDLNISFIDINKQVGIEDFESSELLEDRFRQLNVKTSKEYILKLIKKDIEESIL